MIDDFSKTICKSKLFRNLFFAVKTLIYTVLVSVNALILWQSKTVNKFLFV